MSDDFDDYDQDANAGILDSPGLRDYNNIQSKVAPEGVQVFLNCRRCNRPKQVVLEWPEVVALAANNGQPGPPILPRSWQYSPRNHSAYVGLTCQNCHNENAVVVHLTPAEAARHTDAALRGGILSRDYVHNIAMQVAAAKPR